jgi:hypothetical protein
MVKIGRTDSAIEDLHAIEEFLVELPGQSQKRKRNLK